MGDLGKGSWVLTYGHNPAMLYHYSLPPCSHGVPTIPCHALYVSPTYQHSFPREASKSQGPVSDLIGAMREPIRGDAHVIPERGLPLIVAIPFETRHHHHGMNIAAVVILI